MSERSKILTQQLSAYLTVGGLSALVDVCGFWVIARALHAPLIASIISFIAATVANYFLSYAIAFVRGRFSRRSEVARIAVVSLIGLGINTLAMWVGISLGLRPMVAKMIAVPVVLIWNFMGRRLFVFEREKPPPVVTSLQAIFGGGEKFLSPLARRSRAALTRR